jgi:hypothetical protein
VDKISHGGSVLRQLIVKHDDFIMT